MRKEHSFPLSHILTRITLILSHPRVIIIFKALASTLCSIFTTSDLFKGNPALTPILGNKDKGIPGKFHIVYTGSTINSIDKMKELDEAGVLTTDAAVLGTAGGQFSVVNGTPIQD